MCSRLNAVQRDASHRARKQVVNSPFSVKDRICPLRVTLSMSQLLQRNRDGLQKMTSVISCNVLSIGTKLSDISPVDKKIADFSSPAKEHTRTGKFGVDMEYMTLCMGLWRIQAVQKNVLPAYCPVTIWITYFLFLWPHPSDVSLCWNEQYWIQQVHRKTFDGVSRSFWLYMMIQRLQESE